MENHVHDCTGPDATCPCGYKMTVPRFAIDISVYDNETKRHIVNECFMSDAASAAVDAMEDAIVQIEGS